MPYPLASSIKWLFLLLAIGSVSIAIYFFTLDKSTITTATKASSTDNTIDHFQLVRNDNVWYRLNVLQAYEKPVHIGSIQTSLIRLLTLKGIVFRCVINDFGVVTFQSPKGIIDLSMQHVRLDAPVAISSSLGLSGNAYRVELNLQSGRVTLKNSQWEMGNDNHHLIKTSWMMRDKD